MKASTCCCAPAPIDIIDTTAATPKIIPSMVSSERSLLAQQRLEAAPAVDQDLQPRRVVEERRQARHHRPPPGTGPEAVAGLAAGRAGLGVDQRDVGVGGEVLQDDAVLGDAHDLHGHGLELRAVADVDDRLAFLLEEHLPRQVRDVLERARPRRPRAPSCQAGARPTGARARTPPRTAGWSAAPRTCSAPGRRCPWMRRSVRAGHRLDLHLRRRRRLQRRARSVSAIFVLISISVRSTISATVRPGCTVSPWRYSGRRHAGEAEAAGGVLVVLDDDEAVERRAHGHALDVLAREVGRDPRLAALLLEHGPAARLLAACVLTSSCSCASARRASSSLRLFFSASMRPTNSLPLTSISARRTSCCACSSASLSVEACTLRVGFESWRSPARPPPARIRPAAGCIAARPDRTR